ncbi:MULTISPECIES: TetR/AcrR family transcriptional regulator [Actinoalloteichus]|uniref:Transcriptional regulator, TetR family n=1 Tax=Actinoalloteichus fjordicus TaxID=1612552 RepID=A0AAC9LHZ1_9PSEU|nr:MULTISPECIES: TetR/AcrR family transcriptional regulator [Actinoalloteichus]APU17235.1 transcriptional regulator, TetR family [Actinoalloteichus fjordicus]APU23318.1 transcriptional regulator, TetR family [Actinoalloteichus sp. GBA129-24]
MSSRTRDRILDALQDLLLNHGLSAVTLDAVAAAAEVSKGGLLYHFHSKNDLLTGLVHRLADEGTAELTQARAMDGLDAVRFFLETSVPVDQQEASLYWSVIANLRSSEIGREAAEILRAVFGNWADLLVERIGDPVIAETIRLVGDGLYLSALVGLPEPDPQILRRVFERLLHDAETAAEAASDND